MTGQDAIVLAQAGEVDVLLLDIRMPGIDGVAATGRVTAPLCPGKDRQPS